jgi:hypothetical protein
MKDNLYTTLKNKLYEKGLSEGSIDLYLRNLKKLNNNEEFNSLTFLNKPEVIADKIKDLKDNTKRGYYISIVSSLKVLGDKYKKLYDKYYKLMLDINNVIKEKPTEEKTETQKNNWLDWTDILKKYDEEKIKSYDSIVNKRKITDNQYNDLLRFVILSLFVLIQPRRNLDYMKMLITFNHNVDDKTYNYFDVMNKQFIFNVYKTAKIEKEKTDDNLKIDIPDNLMNILNTYIKFHPSIINKKTNVRFLVYKDGEPLEKINVITRILNKIFDKNIGVSMLRHSYLSHKYGDVLKEQEADAKAMSHSIQTQKDYIKLKPSILKAY